MSTMHININQSNYNRANDVAVCAAVCMTTDS